MVSENFSQLFEKHKKATGIKEGSLVNAQVLFIDQNSKHVVFDTYSKSETKIPIKEFDVLPEVGEEVTLYVVSADNSGNVILSYRKAKKEKRWRELENSIANKQVIEGTIIGKNFNTYGGSYYNGYRINLGEIVGFLHKSYIHGFDRIKDKDTFAGEKYEFLILQMDKSKDTINVAMLNDDIRAITWEDTSNSKIKERDVVEGEVIAIEEYGFFFKIVSKDNHNYLGFVKINDICANRRIEHPTEVVSLGEKIKAKVLRIEPYRFKCSMSSLESNNLEDIKERFKVGEIYEAEITSIISNGLFVLLKDNNPNKEERRRKVSGFIEASEVSWNEVDFFKGVYPVEVVNGKKIVKAKILEIGDIISLSMKQCDMSIFEMFCNKYKEDDIVNCTIRYSTRHRAIAEIDINSEVNENKEKGDSPSEKQENPTITDGKTPLLISGFIDKKEFNWDYFTGISEFSKIRQGEVFNTTARIIKINKENGKIEMSIRRTAQDPVEEFLQKYPIGSIVNGEISHINERDDTMLISIDKWKNILILRKIKNLNPKLKSFIKVKVTRFDRKNRYIIAHSIMSENKKDFNNKRDGATNSLGDNFNF